METTKQPPAGDGASAGHNDTVPQQGANQEVKPRLPHEHDESADSQAPATVANQRIGRIAHDDLAEGLRDTDKGPVLDKTYKKQKG